MVYVIAKPCVGVKDTACVVVCPVDCIHPTKEEPGFAAAEMLHINPEVCIGCGLCVEECPVKAIFEKSDLPGKWEEFVGRNAAYFRES